MVGLSVCIRLDWKQKVSGHIRRNRIKKIKRNKDINFSYISTKENPADIGSKGMSTKELQVNHLCWNGSDWLLQPNTEWPVWNYDKQNTDLLIEIESEYKKTSNV